jgi:hypothetical protein
MPYRLLCALLATTAVVAAADPLAFADQGIGFTVPGAGYVTMSWPEITLQSGKSKATATTVDGSKAVLTYADGTHLHLTLHGTTLTMTLDQVPADSKGVGASFTLPMSLQGADWTIGSKTGVFPAEKPEKPFLYQGNADACTITRNGKPVLAITVPQWSYQQLQDNREWKTKNFFWFFTAPIMQNNLTMTVTIAPGAP